MKRPSIAVLGSSNTDMFVEVPELPRAGETVLGGRFRTAGGGKGANQAVAAARAGASVSLIARVGQDSLGDAAIASLEAEGIDTSHVIRDPRAPSGVALICVSKKGENSIAVASGANGRLSVADVRRARPLVERSQAILLQLEVPLSVVQAAARMARALGKIVILNPAPARRLPASLLRDVSVLTPNESEAEYLTGIKLRSREEVVRAAAKLQQLGAKAVVITLGARGAFVATDASASHILGFPVRAVDTTAAGDTFSGTLAVALLEGRSLEDSVRFANAAAALSVTREGAQPSVPTRKAIDHFLKSR